MSHLYRVIRYPWASFQIGLGIYRMGACITPKPSWLSRVRMGFAAAFTL